MAAKPKTGTAKAAAAAEASADAAADAVETAEENAAEGGEEFQAAIDEAQNRLATLEGDIAWLKDEMKKGGETLTSTSSTLDSLSSTMKDLKDQMTELMAKFQSLTRPNSEAQPAAPKTETPALQVVTELPIPAPPVEKPAETKGSPEVPVVPLRKKRFI